MKLQGFAFISEIVLGARALADGEDQPTDARFVPGQPFQVAKTGTFHSPVYGEIDITPKDLATMLRNFKTLTPLPPTQLPIDYDHLSDEPQQPEDGKAAGWVNDLEIRDGGNTLWCTPQWTKRGAQLIAEGAYRWCSPYFLTDYLDKASGKKVGPTLKAIAITNRPFLEGMQEIPVPAIAASDRAVRRFGQDRRVATPVRKSRDLKEKSKGGLASSEKLARVEQPRKNQRKTGGQRAMKDTTKATAVALDDSASLDDSQAAAPGITCPHCGAPVKHVAPAAPQLDDPEAEAPGDAMDEGGGDADALEELDEAGAGDELSDDAEMDDTEMLEKSTGASGPSAQDAVDKTTQVEAADGDGDEAALDDTEMDDSVEADDTEMSAGKAGQPKKPAAHGMAGVKVPKTPPKASPAPGAAPPPAMAPSAMRELRELREATARLEKVAALNDRREQIRKGRALLQRGLHEGKITPKMAGTPQKPTHTRRFAMRDPKGFAEWLAKEAPIVVEFRERGTSLAETADSAAGTAANVDQMARALMAKDPQLDYSTATRRVLEGNRALSDRYDREMSGQSGPREIRASSKNSAVRNSTRSK